ncbi:unnamed protein product [Clavelina lepadiformis]|uniref:Uncharacterized protein n=1 Tax=Clavelina lepadiformis TaxID=159417 RepID=A0ABP0EWU1_CLALP
MRNSVKITQVFLGLLILSTVFLAVQGENFHIKVSLLKRIIHKKCRRFCNRDVNKGEFYKHCVDSINPKFCYTCRHVLKCPKLSYWS